MLRSTRDFRLERTVVEGAMSAIVGEGRDDAQLRCFASKTVGFRRAWPMMPRVKLS